MEMQNFVTNNVFLDKRLKHNNNKTTTTKQKVKHKKHLPEPGLELGTSRNQSKCVTSASPSHLRVSIVVKLFN